MLQTAITGTKDNMRMHSNNIRDYSENQKDRINRDTSRNMKDSEQQMVAQKEIKIKEILMGNEGNDMKEQLKDELLRGVTANTRQNGTTTKESSSLALKKIILS